MEPASWTTRFFAIILDLIILWIICLVLPLNWIYFDLLPEDYISNTWAFFTNLECAIVGPFYFIGFRFWRSGQTLGKRVMCIRTIKIDGKKLSILDAFLDCLGYVIWPFDWLLGIFFSKRGYQRLTQIFAETTVIYLEKESNI